MNYNQNTKIEQVTEETVIIGVDIRSEHHYARAFDWRGIGLAKKVIRFRSDLGGLSSFCEWTTDICARYGKKRVIIGCEPTGHYWFTFEKYIRKRGTLLVFVNPFAVKRIEELDDNSLKKTDLKEPKTIAKLVVDERYCIPYVPEGIYSDL